MTAPLRHPLTSANIAQPRAKQPLTNAERQARHRQRRADKIARYEAALREIAGSERAAGIYDVLGNAHRARQALGDAA
jgi:hypothetical protein